METVFLAIGLVFLVEGLVLALAPSRIEDIVRMLVSMPVETRRLVGLLGVTLGAILLWLSAWLAG